MATMTKPGSAPGRKPNLIGLERNDYRGGVSTLCAGCGHDSISSQVMAVAFELSIPPHQVIKLSGIGCSSKSPAYFLNRAHGFNSLHGRMPSVATGAVLANRTLIALAVSGDGDTGSIGFGQYKHLIRRNVPMVYIIENNGVYGLTKGQFSVTADVGQKLKYAGLNELPPIDLCLEAIIGGAGFVARSFAGDAKQVRQLLKAAVNFNGTAVLDIISPCVTFNNNEESTKSYPYGKEHEEPLHEIGFVMPREEITVDYEPGTAQVVEMHDGSRIQLKKLDREYDPTNRAAAVQLLESTQGSSEFVTGLIYINEGRAPLTDLERLPQTPLARLAPEQLRPGREKLDQAMAELQ